jgi:hypothetical protein
MTREEWRALRQSYRDRFDADYQRRKREQNRQMATWIASIVLITAAVMVATWIAVTGRLEWPGS